MASSNAPPMHIREKAPFIRGISFNVIPAQAGIQIGLANGKGGNWTPAFAGVTGSE